MRLVRFGEKGREKPGMLDKEGAVRDLSKIISDLTSEHLSPDRLTALGAIDPESLPKAAEHVRLGVPIGDVRKFLAIGLNYADHAAESGLPIPSEPIIFTKAISCLAGPNDDVMLPKGSMKTDWEVELGVVIGTTARYVSEEDALKHVAGYVLVNDVSERSFQKERGSQWDKGKGCDTFGPVGPWLVTADEVGDPQNLDMWLDVNDVRMQSGNTRTMIFDVRQLVSYTSAFITLEPGDILTTGTPPGVGEGKKPPVFLRDGDVMSLGIEKLGAQRQRVMSWRDFQGTQS
jgi:2,4-didehydro-3-deoxy-L-rhamnonate hydrolase